MNLGKQSSIVRTPAPATQIVRGNALPADILADADRSVEDFNERTTLMPLKALQVVGDLLAVNFEDYYDSRGLKITFQVLESSLPEMIPGREYCQIFYYNHPTIPKIIIDKHGALRNRFLAEVGPLVGLEGMSCGQVLQDLNTRVEPIEGVRLRYVRTSSGTTRNGAQKLDDDFQLTKV